MQKSEAAAYLAGVKQVEGAQASAPTNLHVVTGEVGETSEDGTTTINIDGIVFSESDDQYIEMDTLGGLEEGDIATVILTGEQGHGMTPLAIGAPGSVDRVRNMANSAQETADAAEAVANATAQHVWTDDNGLHVTEVEQDDWNLEHSGMNVLINALGQLFRNGDNPLLALLGGQTPSVAIYDGDGDLESDISSIFARDVIELARNNPTAVVKLINDVMRISANRIYEETEENGTTRSYEEIYSMIQSATTTIQFPTKVSVDGELLYTTSFRIDTVSKGNSGASSRYNTWLELCGDTVSYTEQTHSEIGAKAYFDDVSSSGWADSSIKLVSNVTDNKSWVSLRGTHLVLSKPMPDFTQNDVEYSIDDFINAIPVTLYDNANAAASASATLSETAANFKRMTIFYRDIDNNYSSTEVWSPNGKRVVLDLTWINGASTQDMYQRVRWVTISGTTIGTYKSSSDSKYRTGQVKLGTTNSVTNSDYIAITHVIGYR